MIQWSACHPSKLSPHLSTKPGTDSSLKDITCVKLKVLFKSQLPASSDLLFHLSCHNLLKMNKTHWLWKCWIFHVLVKLWGQQQPCNEAQCPKPGHRLSIIRDRGTNNSSQALRGQPLIFTVFIIKMFVSKCCYINRLFSTSASPPLEMAHICGAGREATLFYWLSPVLHSRCDQK